MHKSLRRSKSLVPFHRSSDKKSRHRSRLQSGLEPLNAQRREEGVATRLRNKKYAKKLGREGEGVRFDRKPRQHSANSGEPRTARK